MVTKDYEDRASIMLKFEKSDGTITDKLPVELSGGSNEIRIPELEILTVKDKRNIGIEENVIILRGLCDDSFVKYLENNRCQIWLYRYRRCKSGNNKTKNKIRYKKYIHPFDGSPNAPKHLFTDEQWKYGKAEKANNGYGIACIPNEDTSHSLTGGYVPTEFEITKDNLIRTMDGSYLLQYAIPFRYFTDNAAYGNMYVKMVGSRHSAYKRSPIRSIVKIKFEVVLNDKGKKKNGICKNILLLYPNIKKESVEADPRDLRTSII